MSKKVEFAYKDKEGMTLEWMQEGSKVGYVRLHADADQMPGPTTHSMVIEVYKDNTYEFKLAKKHDEEAEGNLRTKLAPLIRELYRLGYKGNWSRFHDKSAKEVEISEMYFEVKDSKGSPPDDSGETK